MFLQANDHERTKRLDKLHNAEWSALLLELKPEDTVHQAVHCAVLYPINKCHSESSLQREAVEVNIDQNTGHPNKA